MWTYTDDEQDWLRSRKVASLSDYTNAADVADHIVRARALRSEVIGRALREILSSLNSNRPAQTERPRSLKARAA